MAATTSPTQDTDPATLNEWLAKGEAVLVDVREASEHARERIAGSRLMPLSGFDPKEAPTGDGKRLVLHCRSGVRSAQAAALLAASGRSVVQLRGGLQAWKAAGLPVEFNPRVPISLMRQVQIVVGSLILVSVGLAAAVSPWFLLLTGFFGAGLLFAGITGMSGMAALLGAMPWNRAAGRCSG